MKKLSHITKRNFWKTCLSICLASLFLFSTASAYEKEVNDIAFKMAENITKSRKTRIAVVDFTDLQGNVTELGRFIAEEFSVSLLNTGKGFEVVDRTHLRTLLKEHKLSSTGLIDPQTAQKLGQVAGVQALITGTITPFGDSVRLATKILDVDTAKIIGANTGNIPKTTAIAELLAKGITTSSDSSGTASLQNQERSVYVEGFMVELRECKKVGNSITCHFLVTSKNEDKTLRLYNQCYYSSCDNTRIIDELGNEYFAAESQGRIGSNKGNRPDNRLIADIPVQMVVEFQPMTSQAKKIALLQVSLREGGNNHFSAEFRDVKWQ